MLRSVLIVAAMTVGLASLPTLQSQPANAQSNSVPFPYPAKSWGGIVRDGPGQHYQRVTSLQEGEPIEILERTNESFQGLPWFLIRYRGRVGYHWGGIICPNHQSVRGTHGVC